MQHVQYFFSFPDKDWKSKQDYPEKQGWYGLCYLP